MNSPLKDFSMYVLAVLLLSPVPLAGSGKKMQGQVADAGGLLKVHTFCFDLSDLTSQQAAGLKKFIAEASKPKGAFAKLNWQLRETCDNADAKVALSMEEREQTAPAGEHVGNSNIPLETPTMSSQMKLQVITRARMVVANRESGKPLYMGAGAERDNRVSALESLFTNLLKDLNALPH